MASKANKDSVQLTLTIDGKQAESTIKTLDQQNEKLVRQLLSFVSWPQRSQNRHQPSMVRWSDRAEPSAYLAPPLIQDGYSKCPLNNPVNTSSCRLAFSPSTRSSSVGESKLSRSLLGA